jgi:hypothetical protein
MQHSVLSLEEEEEEELPRQWTTITIAADPSHHWWGTISDRPSVEGWSFRLPYH